MRLDRRQLQIYSDPLQHVLIAAAVVAPLAPRTGRAVFGTATAVALLIDLDHAVAARSVRVRDTTGLPVRPPSHSLLVAAAAGALVAAGAGPLHGWAAGAALVSHLLHDAGDRAAPTPLLWPFAPARQIGRRRQLAGTVLLALGSVLVSRTGARPAAGPCAASGDAGAASARPRTA
jgi:LexA-binding, inner membrane-associated putative hydrolase